MVKEKTYDFIDERVVVIYDRTFPLYIILGDKNYLIDSGPAARAPEFFEKISGILYKTIGQKQPRIDTLLLTHSHWDHTGGAHFLQQQYDFDVLASTRTTELLKKPKVIQMIDQMNQGFKKLIGDDSDICFSTLKHLSAVQPAESISISSKSHIEVIDTPGHTRCSIAFLLHPGNILFPGDAAGLMEPDSTIRPLFFSSYSDYENSIRSLLELEVEVMALPHNKPVKGKARVKSFLEASLQKTREVRNTIREYLADGRDVIQVSELIYEQEFPNISFMGPRDILIMNLESMVRSVYNA